MISPPNPEKREHSKVAPESGNHRGWAEFWGAQCLQAIDGVLRRDHEHLNTLHAVRSAKMAWFHACKAKDYRYWDWRWRDEQVEAHARENFT